MADFGDAKDYRIVRTLVSSQAGTFSYRSPERLNNTDSHTVFGEKSDIFSCGLVLYEMMHQRLPYSSTDETTVRKEALIKPFPVKRSVMGESYSEELCQLVEGCLKKDKDERLSYDACLSSPSLLYFELSPTSQEEMAAFIQDWHHIDVSKFQSP